MATSSYFTNAPMLLFWNSKPRSFQLSHFPNSSIRFSVYFQWSGGEGERLYYITRLYRSATSREWAAVSDLLLRNIMQLVSNGFKCYPRWGKLVEGKCVRYCSGSGPGGNSILYGEPELESVSNKSSSYMCSNLGRSARTS